MYFDYLKSKNIKKRNEKTNFIMLASTWVNQKNNLFEDYSFEIIDILLKNKFKVVLRPHPEHFKISVEAIKKIKNKFSHNNNFFFEDNINNFDNLEKSDLLITDYSGISIEYLLIFKKPVIFVNSSQKINNKDYKELNIEHIEKKIRRDFGYEIKPENISDIKNLAELAIKRGIPKEDQDIENFINKNFYNRNNVKKIIADIFLENKL